MKKEELLDILKYSGKAISIICLWVALLSSILTLVYLLEIDLGLTSFLFYFIGTLITSINLIGLE